MIVGAVKETYPAERRVALVPSVVAKLEKQGLEVVVENGAGQAAGFPDQQYVARGARMLSRAEVFEQADILVQVRSLGSNLQLGRSDLPALRRGQVVLGMCDPLGEPKAIADVAQTGATLFALELMPRITRAQAMDVLSSMATVAGYRAVLLGAMHLPKMFPMITYAAGMLRPARVFVIGAGVAGLRAIATAKQLGAIVQAHDIRPTSRDEVKSVGAKFVELTFAGPTQDEGGYARKLTEEDYQRQRELIADVCHESDLVITTAAIPGRKSPLLITADAVRRMAPGSVIIDLASERGGNCELTKADETVVENGVTILGPTNLPSECPAHSSEMFANNVARFLQSMVKDGQLQLNLEDEVIAETLVAHEEQVTHGRIRGLLDLPPLEPAATEANQTSQQAEADSGDAEAETNEDAEAEKQEDS